MGFPLFWDWEPLVLIQGTLLTLTPGTAWTSSDLIPLDTGLRPLPLPPGSWIPCEKNGGEPSGVDSAQLWTLRFPHTQAMSEVFPFSLPCSAHLSAATAWTLPFGGLQSNSEQDPSLKRMC